MPANMLSRRSFLKGTALAAAGGVLAACAPVAQPDENQAQGEQPEGDAPPAEGVLLRMWSGWGGEGYTKCWEEIIASEGFKSVLGNNTFEFKFSVGEEAVLTAIAGGEPPDAATCINYLGFMSRDVLLPIDDMIATSDVKKETFIEGNWDMGFYKGVQYAIPSQECFVQFGLNYNSQIVEEVGLDPDAPPETWDDAYAWHEKLTSKDSAGNLTRLGINPYGAMAEGMWDTSGWMPAVSWDWTWFDDESRTFDLNNEHLVDVFKTFKKFVDLAGVDNTAALYSVSGRDTWGGAYNSGVECCIIEGYWHPGETYFSAPEIAAVNRASWLPVPAARKGDKVQGTGGHLWTIMKGSKRPETMLGIGNHLNTQEPCDIIWNTQGWLPAVKSFLDSVDTSKYPGLDFYFRSVKEATKIYAPPRCEIYTFISNEYMSLKEQVNRDEMTAEQAAEELQKRTEEEYKNAGFAA